MSNTTTTTTVSNAVIIDPSNQIKYIVMQIFYIPSIICSILTLTHLLSNRKLRSTLHNHTSLVLLIISISDSLLSQPFTLNYLRTGRATPATNAMCISWNFFNGLCATAIYWTMAWSSIERHLLIFHSTLFNTHRKRVFFHYIPLFMMTMIYPMMVKIVLDFLYPCVNQFNMLSLYCGYGCALKIPSVALYYRITNNFVPVFIITASVIILILRVIRQKRRIQNNRVHWRRHRRMLTQLLTLASLFLILTLPSVIVGVIQNCCLPTFAASLQIAYFTLLLRFITILMPFMCLASLPEVWSKMLWWKKNQVHSVATPQARTNPFT